MQTHSLIKRAVKKARKLLGKNQPDSKKDEDVVVYSVITSNSSLNPKEAFVKAFGKEQEIHV